MAKSTFKFFWNTHKWVGICVSVFVLLSAGSGLLLLLKKDFQWIQPPTQVESVNGDVKDFISLARLYEIVFAAGHEELREAEDIDRIDFRPKQRVFKVRSKQRNFEIQVGAVSGEILSREGRWSDWIEDFHDGSLFGGFVHGYLMLVFAVCLMLLAMTGVYLWLVPLLKKKKKKRQRKLVL